MRLFLASQNLEGGKEELQKLVGPNKKVAYIANAKDDWSAEDRRIKFDEHLFEFSQIGLELSEIDLRKHITNKISEKELSDYGLIWLSGGNTFLLRRALYDSGLDKVIKKLLKDDKVVVGGSSAGSIVVTPSLHGTENGDDPSQVQKIYGKKIIWSGLNIVKYYIVPHYQSDWFGKEAQSMIDYFKHRNFPYKALKDGQVIIIIGEKEVLLK